MAGESASSGRLRRIVIVGDGLTGWLAAAALGKALRIADYSIRVVAADGGHATSLLADADGTLPLPEDLARLLLPDEDGLVGATGGAFSLGVAFSGWSAPDGTWFHPFGPAGAALGPVPFHHLALRARAAGRSLRFADYSLCALAAQAGRFARPDRDPGSVRSTLRYGLHLDCQRLSAALRAIAESAGACRADGLLERIERKPDGSVTALTTSRGEEIEADLFLDCSGTQALLAGEPAGAAWQDWSDWLPCDRVLRTTLPATGAPPCYSLAQAHVGGWMRQLPLRNRTVLFCFHRTEFFREEQAVELLRATAGGTLPDVAAGGLRFGRRALPWHGNCVALGEAAAVVDPLAASNLHLAMLGVGRLVRLLPRETGYEAVAAEYNRELTAILDHARDFAMLPYKRNGRRGEALWDACREMPIPEPLEYKLKLFEARARVPMYDEDPFDEESWINLLDAMGVRPRRYSPSADGFPAAEIEAHLGRVRAVMLEALRTMPTHGEYLEGLPEPPVAL